MGQSAEQGERRAEDATEQRVEGTTMQRREQSERELAAVVKSLREVVVREAMEMHRATQGPPRALSEEDRRYPEALGVEDPRVEATLGVEGLVAQEDQETIPGEAEGCPAASRLGSVDC